MHFELFRINSFQRSSAQSLQVIPINLKLMKIFAPLLFLASIAFSAVVGCSSPPRGDDAEISNEKQAAAATGQTFVIDTADAWIRFNGFGVGKNHPGRFHVSSGTVSVDSNMVTGGKFTIDIRSMRMDEEGQAIKEKLRPHLLSGDFFDADKFGTATFEITGVQPYSASANDSSVVEGANLTISGNLTLKDVTRNISFPARVDLDDNTLKASANFDIDRTQWKMNYGNDKTLGDQFISERVNITFDLRATAQ